MLLSCLVIPACSSEDAGRSLAAGGSGPEGTGGSAGARGSGTNVGGGTPGPDAMVRDGAGQEGGADGGGSAVVDAGHADGSTCPSPVATDAKANERTSCTFKAERCPSTRSASAHRSAWRSPFDIIVVMKENRTYDEYFGQLSKSGQPDLEPLPATFSTPAPTAWPRAKPTKRRRPA
jgi:hypothetical protein